MNNNFLDKNINKYGGGGTNIYLALKNMEKIIEETKKDEYIVIFMSDGGHNVGGDINECMK